MSKVEKYITMRMDMLKEELHKNPSEENTLVIMHSVGELMMVLDLVRRNNTPMRKQNPQ